jgi:hypothetical protein
MNAARNAVYSGVLGTAVAMAVATLLARRGGGRGWATVNGSSQWLVGDEDAELDHPEPMVTTIGLTTNLLAGVFWGSLLEPWRLKRLAIQGAPRLGMR